MAKRLKKSQYKWTTSNTTTAIVTTSKISSLALFQLEYFRTITMNGHFKKLLFIAIAVFSLAVTGTAQNRTTFSDPTVEFTFEIPDERWKVVGKAPVNLVNATANEGDLEIRKLTLAANRPLAELMKAEEEKLQFLRGFVAGKDENFSGALRGSVYNYEFVSSGRGKAGRFYYLRNGDTVYVLRFTGYTDKLRSLRTQTDIMARTFQIKK